jgi:hypothetical protein
MPDITHKYAAFVCHYMINRLERLEPFHLASVLPQNRTTDWVRVKGVCVNLDIVVQPRCGFRLRIVVFQTPHDLSVTVENAANNVSNNASFDATLPCKQGGYKLNGKLFTQLHHVQNDPEECNQPLDQVEASLDDSYSDLFTWQKKTYNTLEFHNAIHRMRLKAPWVRVLLDTNRQYVNRKKFPKQMRFNKMLRMNSTWAYPPTVMNGNVVVRDNTSPNRKVFVMVIATPIMGPPVVDPMQDMFGLNIADKLRPGEDNEHIRYACSRSGSMVSDQFGDAVKVEPMETIEEEGDGDLYDPATGRVTRSKSKTQEPDPLDDANQEVSDFVQALQINREINKRERSKKPYERKVGKPPKVPKILTDDFGWAKSKTIMIRPTFRFWYKNQYKYKKYSRSVGFPRW